MIWPWPDHNDKHNPIDLWHLRHWLQFWQLRTWIHDNLCYLTIKSDTGQHSQFLRCFRSVSRLWWDLDFENTHMQTTFKNISQQSNFVPSWILHFEFCFFKIISNKYFEFLSSSLYYVSLNSGFWLKIVFFVPFFRSIVCCCTYMLSSICDFSKPCLKHIQTFVLLFLRNFSRLFPTP